MRYVQLVTYAIILIGAINWGFMGFFDMNLVGLTFGYSSLITKFIYSLVGLSAIINMVLEVTVCKSPSRCFAYQK